MASQTYHIILKSQGKECFVVKCLELPSCLSEGKTKKEALKNIQDAIKLYLAELRGSIV